jgi:hypothetical protein
MLKRLCQFLLPGACLLFGATGVPAQQELQFSFGHATEAEHAAGRKVLWMKGEIAQGDLVRLQRYLAGNAEAFVDHGGRVVFSVDGGDVEEAILIGHFLRDAMMEAWLPDASRTRCVSACFFMFAGAVTRVAVAGSVGIHRPRFGAADLASASAAAVRRRYDETFEMARSYLDALLVPRYLTEKMLTMPWEETYWLSREDLDRLGGIQPWFDDFSAARCGIDPGLDRRLRIALDAGFESESQALLQELEGATPCIAELSRQHRRRVLGELTPGDAE